MTTPKTLYDAAISYRTPAGRKVRFYCKPIAAFTLTECEEELRYRLNNEGLYGRRKVASVAGEFTATIMGKQIQTK